jgi:hypothetical protein
MFIVWWLISIKTVQPLPQVSTFCDNLESLDWLDLMSDSNSVLSNILAVIHLELHDTGQKAFDRLRQCDNFQPQEVLHRWTSAFSGVSLISNLHMPLHWDTKSRMEWYDLLVTLGNY